MTDMLRKVSIIESLIRVLTLIGALMILFLTFLVLPFVTGEIAIGPPIGGSPWIDWIFWFILSPLIFVLAIGSYFLAPWIIKRQYKHTLLQENYSEIYNIVLELSKAQKMKRPPTQYFLDVEEPFSFIFGRTARNANLMITKGLIELLKPEELRAVISHELSHIRNRDMPFVTWGVCFLKGLKYWFIVFACGIVITGIVEVSAWTWDGMTMSRLFGFIEMLFRGNVLLFIFFLLVPALSIYSVSRVREYLADARATLTLGNYSDLVSALIKIMRRLVLASFSGKRNKGPAHLSFVSLSPLRILPSFIVQHTVATHPPLKHRLNAIKTEKYIIRDKKLYLPEIETSIYAGFIVFYFFVVYAFVFQPINLVLRMEVLKNPLLETILLIIPLLCPVFINSYMIRYSDLGVLEALGSRKIILYLLGITARNLISCGAFFCLIVLLIGTLEGFVSILGLYCIISILFSMSLLLIKAIYQSYKKSCLTQTLNRNK